MAIIDLSKVMNLADAQEIYKDLRDRIKNAGSVKDVKVDGVSVLDENGVAIIVLPTVPVSDVQLNGTSILSSGIANIPKADYGVYGVVKTGSGYGVSVTSGSSGGTLMISGASDNDLKAGTSTYKPITAANQHKSVFYALSKLAGVDLASGSDTVGVYPQSSKTAIQTMLGIEADIPLVETVTGATASITGMPNVRYICDTAISELTITPPASGSIVVRFTAGSNSIVSLPQTVKLPEWFDISSLEAGTTYELIISDGVYGGVMSWA